MSLPICEHIKPGGTQCGSPSVRGEKYCHYHAGAHRLIPPTNLFVLLWNPGHEKDPCCQYEFPQLEDGAAIQVGFMQLIHAVAQQRIDDRRAKMILSALHGAAANLRQMNAALAPAEEPAEASQERGAPSEDCGEAAGEGRNGSADSAQVAREQKAGDCFRVETKTPLKQKKLEWGTQRRDRSADCAQAASEQQTPVPKKKAGSARGSAGRMHGNAPKCPNMSLALIS